MKESVNPYDGEKLFQFKELNNSELEEKIKASHECFLDWKKTSYEERSKLMFKAAEELRNNKRKYAEIITKEMGKPISQSIAEVEKCAWACEYYAENSENQLQDEIIETDAETSYVKYQPLGVILAVMPWNYPFWQVFRFVAPNLMAGNVGILKHASNVMKSAEMIQEVFENAGFPKGCFQNLVLSSDKIKSVIENDLVKAVTLTGSKPAGASVASIAGENIKKSVLELGGSNALVVFEDANLDETVETCAMARFQNVGQSCIAGKRLLVHRSIAEEFTEKYVEKVKSFKVGDPMAEDTYIGVMAREDLAEDLEKQVSGSIEMGAKVVLGGNRKGTFFEPTILSEVTVDMPIFKEETFGPAIGITIFDTDEEAVELSNNSVFGLGVSIFSSNKDRVEKLIPQFDEGAVFVNELVKSDPRLPFGGVGISGYGRELSSHGIKEFLNKKTVYIKK
ncbi:NAD-dependent succinate-semialdehyde dehydrogenase [Zobellia barbeyronii]|uniref:NAD-dependent succinate-semialdehyde dehydrogenase n=1 Tax=Zobellia barbeyronii TaxID=2748009 RepID=A0ABS5WHR1_9FLAO|nr:NAD-dependent succinate-semialdehyde dehydrogenase [Zobellia barbeyronii]MBT2162946.1 NAD-dependent succinate-semialdehyde dehydrogenase [Zobellia barbeyronii]